MWRCQYCETFNNDDSVVCEVCGNSKGTQSGMPEVASTENVQSHTILDMPPEVQDIAYVREEQPYISGRERVETPAPEPVYEAAEEIVADEPKPRKKGGWVIGLIVVLIILIAGGTVSWVMFKEEIMAFVGIEAAEDASPAPISSDIGGMLPTTEPVSEVILSAEEITYAQDMLCSIGLLSSGSYTPGQYDEATAAAVLSFHQQVNTEYKFTVLPADGTISVDTIVQLEQYQNENFSPVVNSVKYDNAQTLVDESVNITVSSNKNADCLIMYSESSEMVSSWKADGNSEVIGKERIWKVKYSFTGAGDRAISFAVSNDGGNTVGATVQANILVVEPTTEPLPVITSVKYDREQVLIDESVNITISSNINADCLIMYAEDGIVVRMWEADGNSEVNGDKRIWNVEHVFTGSGDRAVSFAVSNDGGVNFGASVQANMLVVTPTPVPQPVISSVKYDNEQVAMGESVVIKVSSNVNADCLIMYSESGEIVRSWAANGNSEVSGSERIWDVKHTFTGAGTRAISFAVSNDGGNTTGTKYETAIKIVSLDITSIVFKQSIAYTNEEVIISAITDARASFLHMYNENMEPVTTWKAAESSSVNGSTRTWEVSYKFVSQGIRKINFCVSCDNNTVGEAKSAKITIVEGLPGISEAYFDKDTAAAGEELTLTVKTNADATSIIMCSEDGSAVKKWNAEENSIVNGTERIWNVKYAFTGNGDRKITIHASNDGGTTIGAGCEVTITVK